jgi:hypothetical protein
MRGYLGAEHLDHAGPRVAVAVSEWMLEQFSQKPFVGGDDDRAALFRSRQNDRVLGPQLHRRRLMPAVAQEGDQCSCRQVLVDEESDVNACPHVRMTLVRMTLAAGSKPSSLRQSGHLSSQLLRNANGVCERVATLAQIPMR